MTEINGGSGELSSNKQSRRSRSFNNKPSWLLCTIADLDERMKMLTWKTPKDETSDSFATRANSYYHERPQLLELLNDLYNGYLSLADRYCQSLSKNQRPSPIPQLKFDNIDEDDDICEVIDSDVESSLSFQLPVTPRFHSKDFDVEMIVADLVMKTVDYEIVLNELNVVEKWYGESSKKSELQRNLLDVLESERLILLNDNATLGYRVNALIEENKGLVSESMFLKRKAGELARCVLMTREDHRVCMLSRKIEDLQGQIYGLEKRNKEYYEQLVRKEEKSVIKGRKSFNGKQVTLDECLQVPNGGTVGLSKCFSLNVKKMGERDRVETREVEGGKVTKKLWDKVVKKFDLFNCNPHFYSTGC